MTALTILIFASAYLLGSISSAILVCRLFSLGDPREQGSGNPGATNVLRIGGKLPAALVLVFDVLKGTVPVWASYYLGLEPINLAFVAVMACLGHMYPLFFGFSGGKAVATAFGAILPLGLDLAAILIVVWGIMVRLTGYSSLAAIVSVSLAPLFTWLLKPEYTLPVGILSVLIVLRHKDNMIRLLRGQESKISKKSDVKI
ncbi:glycerol-3-phosphate 1-O-acyltransferase PlsY [Paraglaciecola sp. MB-3u-78]|jgi:glycerol-3-phosphate acyltransferase PlsY|uniref:glycerol-3-phosphate 1-O-acyltransferase PlsY n=1 Tax=Paraglaciecola sp. MB-3u-78 TaxID=2058332 RepID=UPI000C3308FB|nr:glycerol-3-phosphate 1-O-acyltransferase PlsY [Paraglaciecola sp. MB-3u-78]PKG98724.1 glycerol-3-phosphate acyltransferase [Paraglaciecola sp. MB-3u-78]